MTEEQKLKNGSFKVFVIETLERMVKVNAGTEEEAIEKVEQMYKDGEIVLDASDHTDTKFEVLNKM